MLEDPLADARMECSGNNRSLQGRRPANPVNKSDHVTRKTPLPPQAPVSNTLDERSDRYHMDPEKRRVMMNHRQRMAPTSNQNALRSSTSSQSSRRSSHNSRRSSTSSQNSIGSWNENRITPTELRSSSNHSYESREKESANKMNSGAMNRSPHRHRTTRPVSDRLPISLPQSSVPNSHSDPTNLFDCDQEHLNHLISQGFPKGLARAVAENAQIFQHRLWVVDNSGSMQILDGNLIENDKDGKSFKSRKVTRWEEIRETVRYHASMAISLNSPTTFKLLNDPGAEIGPQEFSVAMNYSHNTPQEEIRIVEDTMLNIQPSGVTPLTRHIWEIQQMISAKAPELRREGKKVVLVIATDGLPTDEEGYGGEYVTDEFLRAVKSLESLPVWLVVRLCTDEQQVTKFYNSLDTELELSLEVIDDFVGEAHEVNRFNSWLNYCLPMHRLRELGYHDRLFDLIDERPLTKGEIRDFCCLIFGIDDFGAIPDPASDWSGFMKAINHLQRSESKQWNPIRKKKSGWIRLKQLNKIYGNGPKCTIS